jgi:hypothetical protein
MNLGTLLAAGKSLALGHKGASPYCADKHVCLPKFTSTKNPFGTPPKAKTAPLPAEKAALAPVRKATAPNAAKTQKLPPLFFAAGKQAVAPEKPAAPVQQLCRSLEWVSRLNPFAIQRARRKPVAKNEETPRQTELSLDAVKVLRNDLHDADVEIVPLKSRPPHEATVPVLEPAKKSWELLGERLLRAEVT